MREGAASAHRSNAHRSNLNQGASLQAMAGSGRRLRRGCPPAFAQGHLERLEPRRLLSAVLPAIAGGRFSATGGVQSTNGLVADAAGNLYGLDNVALPGSIFIVR